MAARVLTEEDLEPLRRELAELRTLLKAGAIGDVLSTEQAAELAGVKPKTVRTWIEAGTLRARHRGRRLVILRADLEAHLVGDPAPPAVTLLEGLTPHSG